MPAVNDGSDDFQYRQSVTSLNVASKSPDAASNRVVLAGDRLEITGHRRSENCAMQSTPAIGCGLTLEIGRRRCLLLGLYKHKLFVWKALVFAWPNT